ncbi:MAG: NAD(P)/FAD-dependent oxidoreductase [Melioribacteraceae bacterium]|nr:NAD(P)/FAD-dependent oxidoreductase [Melioribacteraceae bacterium]
MIKNEYDIVVVGAGPAGSTAAKFASEQGASVLMLEKDRDVGYPVRCGEAVSRKGLEEFVEPDEKFIASVINNFSMNAPDGNEVIIPLEQNGYVLERRIFDYELANLAADRGTQILTRAYVNGLLFDGDKVSGVRYEYNGEQKEVKCKIVIAADGVESRVGRWAGLKTYTDFRDMECCVQITAANIPVDQSTCYFYFGEEFAPNGYFWIFPKGKNKANIGLGISGMIGKKRSALSYLNNFMQKHYPEASILTQVAGGVPSSVTLDKISAPGIILVGDAARQVNPLSGGGITSGMRGGRIGGTIAGVSVIRNKPDHLLSYDEAWHSSQGKKHEIFDRIKRGIYNFSDKKFNGIASSFLNVPYEKRTLGNLFKTALFNNPALMIDIAKVFVVK